MYSDMGTPFRIYEVIVSDSGSRKDFRWNPRTSYTIICLFLFFKLNTGKNTAKSLLFVGFAPPMNNTAKRLRLFKGRRRGFKQEYCVTGRLFQETEATPSARVFTNCAAFSTLSPSAFTKPEPEITPSA